MRRRLKKDEVLKPRGVGLEDVLVAAIDEIAVLEDRSRSEIIRRFALEGIERYWKGRRRPKAEPANGSTTDDAA